MGSPDRGCLPSFVDDSRQRDARPRGAGGGAPRGRRRLPAAGGAPPRGAARPLLPDARLGPRRRRRAPGHPSACVAGAAPVRGSQLPALLAVPHRDERLPRPDRAAPQASAPGRLRPGRRSPRRPRRTARRVDVGGSVSRRAAPRAGRLRESRSPIRAARERGAGVHRGLAEASGHAARRVDPARRAGLLRARPPRRSRGRSRPPTAPSAGRARRSPMRSPSRASRPTCACSATTGSGRSSSATSMRGNEPTSTPSSPCWPRTQRSRCRRSRPGIAAGTSSPSS